MSVSFSHRLRPPTAISEYVRSDRLGTVGGNRVMLECREGIGCLNAEGIWLVKELKQRRIEQIDRCLLATDLLLCPGLPPPAAHVPVPPHLYDHENP